MHAYKYKKKKTATITSIFTASLNCRDGINFGLDKNNQMSWFYTASQGKHIFCCQWWPLAHLDCCLSAICTHTRMYFMTYCRPSFFYLGQEVSHTYCQSSPASAGLSLGVARVGSFWGDEHSAADNGHLWTKCFLLHDAFLLYLPFSNRVLPPYCTYSRHWSYFLFLPGWKIAVQHAHRMDLKRYR